MRHCEAHRAELCVGMGCGNLIHKLRLMGFINQIVSKHTNAQAKLIFSQ
jgi:hypothetical protein